MTGLMGGGGFPTANGNAPPPTDLPTNGSGPSLGQPAGRKSLLEQVIGVGDLRLLQPPDPLIDGLIYHGEMAQLSGNPGSFKSFLSLAWACAVATGCRSWEGHRITNPGPVVYIAAEGASGLWLRIAAWCQVTGVSPELLNGRLFVLPTAAQLGSMLDIAEVIQVVRDRGARLVVMDTRHRMTTGLDENSAKEQGTAIRHCDHIREETGTAVLLVHHSSRAGTAGRGSSAWDGAVWSDLRIKAEGRIAEITCEKHKDAPDGCKHEYRLKTVVVNEQWMPGRDERQRETLVPMADVGYADSDEIGRADQAILDVIKTMATSSGMRKSELRDMAISDKGIPRATVYRSITKLVKVGAIVNVGTKATEKYVLAQNMLDIDTGGNSGTSSDADTDHS